LDPEHNVPKEIKNEVKSAFVRSVREALEEAFGKDVVQGTEDTRKKTRMA